MTSPKPLAHILKTKPYVPGGKLAATGPVAMLASNENPLGVSEKAAAAMRAAADSVNLYPDPTYEELREAIAKRSGIADPGRLMVSAGSDELISLLVHCYAGAGDEVVFSEHGFAMYPIAALNYGATPVPVPAANLASGVNAFLGAVTDKTRLVFIANPNNPTGTMMSVEDMQRLQDGLTDDVMFVIDGAYAEYCGKDYEDALRDLVESRDNTVMLRTFSKLFGMAALRLGWGYFPAEIASILQRVRGPFNVNAMAVSGAIAALEDEAFIARSIAHNEKERARLTDALNAMGLATPKSYGNFVLPDFGNAERAKEADAYLKAQNILVRGVAGYGLPTYLRITVGSEADNTRLLEALKKFMR